MEVLMLNSDRLNSILDDHMLSFLDDYEEEFGHLPTEIEKNIWIRGFVNACEAISQATNEMRKDV